MTGFWVVVIYRKNKKPMPSFPSRRESGYLKLQKFIRSNNNLSIVIPA
ncbi:hypothetical protein NMH_1013 [Neisseria meningitidis H44/76]|uniref:Uncharacterized protein n=1 Tax=Neisseria meningitidis serogroup B / serotype 15 (strain H44/76) TaxID=909420 RepID=E6MWH3_NEIMH|nr:hypothetical protein NMH_1013 [Neisseria meningitidis H44/76]